MIAAPTFQPDLAERVDALGMQIDTLVTKQADLAQAVGADTTVGGVLDRLDVFQGYIGVFVAAFLITLLATPIVRRMAVAHGVIDRPSDPRKVHRMPIAYLGGVAVYMGLMAGILYSYFAAGFPWLISFHPTAHLIDGAVLAVPPWIPLGLTVIMLVGLIDDVVGCPPHVKVGGQLFAAAALAYGEIGTNVARGVLTPTLGALLHNPDLTWIIDLGTTVPLIGNSIEIDLIYWAGAGIIAVFVLGGCNASNLIDGLDGLLSGVTAIAGAGLLMVALWLAMHDSGPADAMRIVLCMCLLGATLGFLPHNFNPATIFLGDCGSLSLGYFTVVIILLLGDQGQTYLVIAGLIIYGVPIIDTVLAIVRRKLAGKRMSDADSDHLHHMLKRATGGVKRAVIVLYGLGISFAILGVAMSMWRARFIYAIALIFASYIIVYSIKIARRAAIEAQAAAYDKRFQQPAPTGQTPAHSDDEAEAEPPTGTTPAPVSG